VRDDETTQYSAQGIYNAVQPVFLDIWRREGPPNAQTRLQAEPILTKCALYVRDLRTKQRIYITRNFEIKDPQTGKYRDNFDEEFLVTNSGPGAAGLKGTLERYLKIEDLALWDNGGIPAGSVPHVVSPQGGTLLLFDSVSLPHEVMTTIQGERLALAGWFHEKQQDYPDWFL
jgi:2OG-Fe(II) oxygenase superfamily